MRFRSAGHPQDVGHCTVEVAALTIATAQLTTICPPYIRLATLSPGRSGLSPQMRGWPNCPGIVPCPEWHDSPEHAQSRHSNGIERMFSAIRKITLSASFGILFALYSLQRRDMLPGQQTTTTALVDPTATLTGQDSAQIGAAPIATISDSPTATQAPEQTVAVADQRSTDVFGKQPSTAIANPTETPTPETASTSGQYVDGTYVGPQADAHWGNVQVQVVVENGQISSVEVLEYPNHRSRSRSINKNAVPELVQEAIQAQSADVDIVSGATDTSEGFINSLESALQDAAR